MIFRGSQKRREYEIRTELTAKLTAKYEKILEENDKEIERLKKGLSGKAYDKPRFQSVIKNR